MKALNNTTRIIINNKTSVKLLFILICFVSSFSLTSFARSKNIVNITKRDIKVIHVAK